MAMNVYYQDVLERIRANYEGMTDTEKVVADFFLQNKEAQEFSAKVLSKKLHVSETTLSRFAKKINLSGYREFLYMYEINFHMPKYSNSGFIQKILDTYEHLLQSFNGTVDSEQVETFCRKLSKANRIAIYALGSSACAAHEFKLRFMRLGLQVEVFDNPHMMQMQAVLSTDRDLAIGMSISGESGAVLGAVRTARQRGAGAALITSGRQKSFQRDFDQVILIPSIEGLSLGDNISPQLPLLIMTDILYSSFVGVEPKYRQALFRDTLTAIQKDMHVEPDEHRSRTI